jgi:hypothetical protein
VYDYAWSTDPYEGDSSLYMSCTRASFGVYQEFCVEPGETLELDWAWMGRSNGNGWWEVLIVDAPYSYEAVDDPSNHPETLMAAKWEQGFGGEGTEPEQTWATGETSFVPVSDTIAIVLKCGSSEGGFVEAWFDAVVADQETDILEVLAVSPPMGSTNGGDAIGVLGRVFPDGATVDLGDETLEQVIRNSTCELRGLTPPGEEGYVDVVVTTPDGSATLESGFRYVPPPVVTGVDPASGPVEGGTDITIDGQHFVEIEPGDITVQIGTGLLTSVLVFDENVITGIVPAGIQGPVDVTVTTPFGQAVVAEGYTYEDAGGALFVRGDCNADGEVNITDGVFLLGFLFLGGEAPGCREACNPDGGTELNISDGITILNFLFLGGPAPVAPHPGCGPDTTAEVTCETPHSGCL